MGRIPGKKASAKVFAARAMLPKRNQEPRECIMVKVDRLPLHETRVNGDEVEHLSISINGASEGQH